jgi:hypothetical protein
MYYILTLLHRGCNTTSEMVTNNPPFSIDNLNVGQDFEKSITLTF